jgi:hypothetical protein
MSPGWILSRARDVQGGFDYTVQKYSVVDPRARSF